MSGRAQYNNQSAKADLAFCCRDFQSPGDFGKALWDEAIKVAEGREVWYPVVETVADGVLAHRPEWVARVSLKHAERLMSEPKSKNYPFAAEWLKRSKKACTALGQTAEWKVCLQKTTEKYSRRPALQAHLARW
jgi:uncharacterized Zn finger protein